MLKDMVIIQMSHFSIYKLVNSYMHIAYYILSQNVKTIILHIFGLKFFGILKISFKKSINLYETKQ